MSFVTISNFVLSCCNFLFSNEKCKFFLFVEIYFKNGFNFVSCQDSEKDSNKLFCHHSKLSNHFLVCKVLMSAGAFEVGRLDQKHNS